MDRMVFPENFSALLLAIAVAQSFFGVAKSKGCGRGLVFWISSFIQFSSLCVCATALILQSLRVGYGGLERTSAYVAVIVSIVFHIYEFALIYDLLLSYEIRRLPKVRNSAFLGVFITVALTAFAIPIYIAHFSNSNAPSSSEQPFKHYRHRVLLLLLSVSPALSFALLIFILLLIELLPFSIAITYRGLINISSTVILLAMYGVFALVLGISILRTDDNVSLSFLVILNILPISSILVSSTSLDQYEVSFDGSLTTLEQDANRIGDLDSDSEHDIERYAQQALPVEEIAQ